MHGLEIIRNGKRTIVAGGDAVISLSAVISVYGHLGDHVQNDASPFGHISVLGASEAGPDGKQTALTWDAKQSLRPGDEILIRFVEIGKPSKPSEIHKFEAEPDE